MKKVFFTDNYYQIAVISFNKETGRGEYRRIHVLGKTHSEGVKHAKTVTDFDYESFNMFLLQYRFLKDVLAKEFYQLPKIVILRSYFEACLRTWSMDCRTNNTTAILHRTANRVVCNYVRNRNQQ